MAAPPSAPGGSFLPFMTSVTTDIYERIEKVSHSLNNVGNLIKKLMDDLEGNLAKISTNIGELIEQGEMNKQMTLEAFADSMNTLIQQIRSVRDENIAGFQSAQTQQMIKAANDTANLLESRMYDIQISFLINGVHALMNAIKAGKVVGIPVPVRGVAVPMPAAGQGAGTALAAPIPAVSAAPSEKPKKTAFFGKGSRHKTHDEIMEEKRKKDKLFGRFLK